MAELQVGAPTRARRKRSLESRLIAVTGVLAGLTVLHDLDHLRQGRALPAVLHLVAVAALVSLAGTVTVLRTKPHLGRPVAMAQGVATILGVGAVHALPQWSLWTDSYFAADADLVSWATIVGMIATGSLLVVLSRSNS